MLNLIHIVGQILFGGFFVWSGAKHFMHAKDMTGYAKSLKVPMPEVAVYGTGIMLILGGLGMLFNMYTLISLIILAVFIIPVSFIAHAYWKQTDPQTRMNNNIQFWKNIALLGAMLLMMQW
jgi:putative oxidoreductase